MSFELVIIALLVLIIVFIMFMFLGQKSKNSSPELLEIIKQMNRNMESANKRTDELTRFVSDSLQQQNKTFISTLQKNTSDLNARLDKAATVIGGVERSIGEMSEIGRAMKDLQDYLKSPKLRGNIGEQVLGQVLEQMLPKDMFALQYGFKTGEKVDAIIRINTHLLSIDAKFPMENFRKYSGTSEEKLKEEAKKLFVRDVKKHIDAISSKYILAAEGTLDYAIMYVPSEAVYYEIISDEGVFTYSNEKRVLIVSPMSFYAYLKAILMSLQGQTIQKKAREILSLLQSTKQDYAKIDEALGTLDKHFGNAYSQLQNVNKFFTRLGQKLTTTELLEDRRDTKKLED